MTSEEKKILQRKILIKEQLVKWTIEEIEEMKKKLAEVKDGK